MTSSCIAIDRQDIWRGAELLEALAPARPDLPSRYRAWSGSVAAFDLDDVTEAACWPTRQGDDLSTFLRCVGAAAQATAWRAIMDGERLRELVAVVSAPLLSAVLELASSDVPPPPDCVEQVRDEASLATLGRRLLLATLPGSIERPGPADRSRAKAAVDAGTLLFIAMGRGHA